MRIDIYQHVTDAIIAAIEAGTPPWQKPWSGTTAGGQFPLRHNGEAYRGINVLMLWLTAEARGYTSPYWMTFNQARELGGKVKKGSKCARSVFYGTFERESEDDGEPSIKRGYAKCNNVFNVDQIVGLPDRFYAESDIVTDFGTEANERLTAFIEATGAKVITSDVPSAYYQSEKDVIHMPHANTFLTEQGHAATLMHEAIHWTGAASRLDRLKDRTTRADAAREELIAEIGGAMLGVRLELEPDFAQNAAYVENWLTALKNDKCYIFKAASQAQAAVDYLINAAGVSEAEQAAA